MRDGWFKGFASEIIQKNTRSGIRGLNGGGEAGFGLPKNKRGVLAGCSSPK
jgi:hypothetical protein